MAEPSVRLLPKPRCVSVFEARFAQLVPVHPNVLSAIKLLGLTPIFYLGLSGASSRLSQAWVLVTAFLVFGALDYADGVVARGRGLATSFGRIFDRVTDYPTLLLFAIYAYPSVPRVPLMLKLGFDFVLLIQFALGMGSTENRLRTTLSYSTLLGLLFVSRGWMPLLVTVELVTSLIWIGACFSALVVLHNFRVLQKRFIADALSALNLSCGIFSILSAADGQFFASLLLLIVGAAFDGFDGAAARRWGGTRFGVYSDDIADAVNYGLAPGAAIYFAVGSSEGLLMGAGYSLFTLGRLAYFTLDKGNSDPNYFSGVPSTSGGLIVLCSVILFGQHPAVLGAMVGLACALMVSFASRYRHPGRAASKHPRRALFLVPLCLLLILSGGALAGVAGAALLILALNLAYGFWPAVRAYRLAIEQRQALANARSVKSPP